MSSSRVCLFLLTPLFFLFPTMVFATESLSMTITPSFFQLTQAPGGEWSSALRLPNTNNFDLDVMVSVQDFRPDGETGNAVFMNTEKSSAEDTRLMSGWFTIPLQNVSIPRGTTGSIPFTIHVPPNADPGGHYSAIVVSTRPSDPKQGGSNAGISSAVSSLFFLRVPGDVKEEGEIRDFYAKQSVLQSPDALFALRFENRGNVHLVPEGSIVITNMWGKERGMIEVNKEHGYGNVLPSSTRKFEFNWHGESNIFEFGRYKALATLVYGEEGRKSVYRTTYFWVIPWKQVLSFGLGIGLFFWFILWSLRRYVHRALLLERERLGLEPSQHIKSAVAGHISHTPQKLPPITFEVLKRPLTMSSVDLRNPAHHARVSRVRHVSFMKWMKGHRAIVGFFLIMFIGFSLVGWYFVEVFQSERTYSMEQVRNR